MTVTIDPETGSVSTTMTKARYNRIAPLYNFVEAIPERRFRPWRKRLLSKAKGTILEIGVGTGKNVQKAGLRVEEIEHLGMMEMVKMITAKTNGASCGREGP